MRNSAFDPYGLSDIQYSLCARDEVLVTDSKPRGHSFEPVSGRINASVMFRLKASGRGKEVLRILSSEGKTAALVSCEGMAVYAQDGRDRIKIASYSDEDWFSVRVRLDTEARRYDVFVDGKKGAAGAAFAEEARDVAAVRASSRMGSMRQRLLFVFRDPVQSVRDRGLRVYDAIEAGIESDGATLVTEKLQRLVDECSASGGGVVYLPSGTFLSGGIELKRGTSLYIERGAALKGVLGADAYPAHSSKSHPNWNMIRQGPQRALVYADGVEGLRIEGGGTIDGSGDFPGDYGSESSRPSAVLLVGCPGAAIRGIHLKDAGMWTLPLVECDGFHIRDVDIDSTWFPNRDGVDFCDCRGGLMEHCSVTADDDAVCFKSGEARGCAGIAVRDCMIVSVMANAVKFGTFSYGGFSGCTVEDCVIKDSRHAAFCVESVDGGAIEALRFERIEVKRAGSAFLVMVGDRGNVPPGGKRRVGSVSDILFRDLVVEDLNAPYGSYVSGLADASGRHPVKEIRFERVKAAFRGGCAETPPVPPEYDGRYPECDMFGVLPGSAFFIRHCDGLRFLDCSIDTPERDARMPFAILDSSGVDTGSSG